MGIGASGKDGGALSSPQAIRAGIWPGAAWETMPVGTTSRTINTVASNTGLRSLVVQDDDGVNSSSSTATSTARMRSSGSSRAQATSSGRSAPPRRAACGSFSLRTTRPSSIPRRSVGLPRLPRRRQPSDGSHGRCDRLCQPHQRRGLVEPGRLGCPGHRDRGDGHDGDRPGRQGRQLGHRGPVFYVFPSSTYDSKMRVGDTWTALAGGPLRRADDDVPVVSRHGRQRSADLANEIPGATSQSYTLTAADVGKYIRVVMNGSSTVGTTFNVDPGNVRRRDPTRRLRSDRHGRLPRRRARNSVDRQRRDPLCGDPGILARGHDVRLPVVPRGDRDDRDDGDRGLWREHRELHPDLGPTSASSCG